MEKGKSRKPRKVPMDAVREAARKRLEEGEVGLEFASITEQLEAVISYLKNLPGRPAVLPEVLAESLKLVGVCTTPFPRLVSDAACVRSLSWKASIC